MSNEYLFNTNLEWTVQRKGRLATQGMPNIEVGTPVEFSGHPNIWSPEHLFIGSVEVCLMATFLAIAEKSKFSFIHYKSEAEGVVSKEDGTLKVSHITLKPHIIVSDEEKKEKALQIIERAKRHCLISASMNTVVTMEPTFEVYGG